MNVDASEAVLLQTHEVTLRMAAQDVAAGLERNGFGPGYRVADARPITYEYTALDGSGIKVRVSPAMSGGERTYVRASQVLAAPTEGPGKSRYVEDAKGVLGDRITFLVGVILADRPSPQRTYHAL